MIIKELASAQENLREKEQFTKQIKNAAIGLNKYYKNSSESA